MSQSSEHSFQEYQESANDDKKELDGYVDVFLIFKRLLSAIGISIDDIEAVEIMQGYKEVRYVCGLKIYEALMMNSTNIVLAAG